MMPIAILCGGLGTRLAPLTDACPKALIDVAGKPFLLHQFDLLTRHGYTDIVLLIGHLGEQIRAVVGDGSRYGVTVRYVEDGPIARRHDGAIVQALPLLGSAFFVLYGDVYLECDYRAIEDTFRASDVDALLTTYQGIDYGLRAFRQFPPTSSVDYPMSVPFEEIGSHEGLARVRALLTGRDPR